MEGVIILDSGPTFKLLLCQAIKDADKPLKIPSISTVIILSLNLKDFEANKLYSDERGRREEGKNTSTSKAPLMNQLSPG